VCAISSLKSSHSLSHLLMSSCFVLEIAKSKDYCLFDKYLQSSAYVLYCTSNNLPFGNTLVNEDFGTFGVWEKIGSRPTDKLPTSHSPFADSFVSMTSLGQ